MSVTRPDRRTLARGELRAAIERCRAQHAAGLRCDVDSFAKLHAAALAWHHRLETVARQNAARYRNTTRARRIAARAMAKDQNA